MPDREIELKLDLRRAGSAKLALSLARLGATRIGSEMLLSRYFDTQAQTLRRHGLTLRVRSVAGRQIQTIKAASSKTAGLFDRSEWETEISDDYPDLRAAEGTPVPSLIGSEPLRLAFVMVIERTGWRLVTPNTELEVALDAGEIAAGGAVEKLTELELELKRGSRRDLFRFTKTLFEDESVRIGVRAKSERGYLLIEGKAATSFKAETIPLRPDMATAEAFAAIAHACFRQYALNEPNVMEARVPEALHQARVAIRRLRSAFSLFKSIVADAETRLQRAFLRELSQLLGQARNLDVLLSRQGPAVSWASSHTQPFVAARENAYDTLIEILDAPAFAMRLIDLVAWIECGCWRRDSGKRQRKGRERPIEVTAPCILQRHWDKLRKAEPRVDNMSPAARHEVRINAKKLRYASEFFADLYIGDSSRRQHKLFVKRLARLQDDLGGLNDIETGDRLIAQLGVNAGSIGGPGIVHPPALQADALPRTAAEILKDAAASFAQLTETPVFWM
jgi:triphosphatase